MHGAVTVENKNTKANRPSPSKAKDFALQLVTALLQRSAVQSELVSSVYKRDYSVNFSNFTDN
jgi:hypothetical protein